MSCKKYTINTIQEAKETFAFLAKRNEYSPEIDIKQQWQQKLAHLCFSFTETPKS